MTSISTAAPQFLVDNLEDAVAFYVERLGFTHDFTYEGLYASVSRDGGTIHLKCAPKLDGERAHRKTNEHLDAYLAVTGIEELYEELTGRGAPMLKPLAETPWGTREFTIEDPYGCILCFSEIGEPTEKAQ